MSIILITGASSGFGMLFAARFAASGHTVYASMRDLGKSADLEAELRRRNTSATLLRLDVTDPESIAAVIAQVQQAEGRLDVLINNAGYGLGGYFEELTREEIRAQFDTNFFGVQEVTRRALPLLRLTAQNARGVKIINISSVQGKMAVPGLSAYSSSKFALEAFSEALYYELLPFNIRVVLVEPGSYRTKIFGQNAVRADGFGDEESPYFALGQRMFKRMEAMLANPDGMRDPEDVARLVEKIARKFRPRLRYAAGRRAKLLIFLSRVLPGRLFQALVARGSGHRLPKQ